MSGGRLLQQLAAVALLLALFPPPQAAADMRFLPSALTQQASSSSTDRGGARWSFRQLTGKRGKAAKRAAAAAQVPQQGPAPAPVLPAAANASLFDKRFGELLTNATSQQLIHAQLDILLDPQQLAGGESTAAHELQDGHAQAALKAAVQLDAASRGAGWASCDGAVPHMHTLLNLTSQLSAQLCYPATRRAVLGSILRARLRSQVAWTRPCEALVSQIAGRLFNVHRVGAAAKGATEFLHVSKSGGTSMCTVAAANGCQITSVSLYRNCMIKPFDDGPRWVSAAVHNRTRPYEERKFFMRHGVPRNARNDTCEHRAGIMARKGWTFYSNEYTLHDNERGPAAAHTCPQLFNVVLLREPLARLKSHIKWIIQVGARACRGIIVSRHACIITQHGERRSAGQRRDRWCDRSGRSMHACMQHLLARPMQGC